jgi:tetratricopeptide (TPR) repeat protein
MEQYDAMATVLHQWERAARRSGRLRVDEKVLDLWLCSALAPSTGETEPIWAPRIRKGSVKSLGTRASAMVLSTQRLFLSAPKAVIQLDLAHLGQVWTTPPDVLRFEVILPAPTSVVGVVIIGSLDTMRVCEAIGRARKDRWQAVASVPFQEIESMHGRDVANEMQDRWTLADPDRGLQAAATFDLGARLARRGRGPDAETLFQAVIDDPDFSAEALQQLGFLQRDRGDLEAARVSFTRALSLGDNEQRATSLYQLGDLSRRAGDGVQAGLMFEQVVYTGDPLWSPIALSRVAAMRKAAGDLTGAETAYRSAIAADHAALAAEAQVDLAIMLAEHGRPAEAQHLYEQVIATEHAGQAPRALLNLGNIARERGDVLGAERAFLDVIDYGDTRLANKAWFNLGHMRKDAGDLAAARDAFLKVANGEDVRLAAVAKDRLRELQTVHRVIRTRFQSTSRALLLLVIATCSVLSIHQVGFAWTTAALVTVCTTLLAAYVGHAIVRVPRSRMGRWPRRHRG